MALFRGVYPIAHDFPSLKLEEAVAEGVHLLVQNNCIKAGDRIILTMGEYTGNEGGTNSLRLVKVGQDGHL